MVIIFMVSRMKSFSKSQEADLKLITFSLLSHDFYALVKGILGFNPGFHVNSVTQHV